MRERLTLALPAGLAALSGAVIALDVDVPVVRPALALVALAGLPTFVVFRRADLLGDHRPARLLYAFGLTLLGLMLVGLLLDVALPVVGVERPLQPAVIGSTAVLLNLALLGWRRDRRLVPYVDVGALARRALVARLEPSQALAALSLVLAVLGAVRLNNGSGPGLALAALALAAGALVAVLVRRESTRAADLRCLGLVALGQLLATSLRGWTITGHDIQSEYLTFRLADSAQRWQMDAWQNAYNACLSLNILPTVLAQGTGFSGVVVFKVLLQVVFALVPILNFLLASRFLPRRLALVAAIVPVALPTFYTDMPYLVRQEVAFLFLALMLVAATAPASARRRTVMAGLFGVGVVVSHYSTTYVMLLGLGAGLLALGGWRLVCRTRWLRAGPATASRPALVLLNPLLVLFLAVASWAWAGPATNTGGHAVEVARGAVAAILGHGEDSPGSSDLSYVFWSRRDSGPRERLNGFVEETVRAREAAPPRALLVRKPDRSMTKPAIVGTSKAPTTALGSVVEDLGVDTEVLIAGARLAAAGVLQVLLLLGLVRLLLHLRRRRPGRRRGRPVPEEAAFVAFGTVASLGVVVVVPQLSVDYGVLRAFEQALLVLSPVVSVGLWLVARALRRREALVVTAVPVALLVVFSGLAAATLGGYSPRLALANSGLYYERYYASDSDVRAIDWVTSSDRSRDRPEIIANRNIGVRILTDDPHSVVADRLFPMLLTRGEYVFVDSRLQQTRRAAVFYTGDLITYRYPLREVERRLDLVYSADSTRIYR